MSETAISRAVRTFDLIPYILNNPGVSIRELAEVFNTSEDQINTDLQLAFMCGLPGYTPYELIELQISDGYVSVRQPQVLDKPRSFTAEEQLALTLGLKSIQSASKSSQVTERIDSLIRKLNLNYANQVNVSRENLGNETLTKLSTAIKKREELQIEYISKMNGQASTRTIWPLKIYFENGFGYLSAFCLTSNATRTFLIGNIKSINSSGKKYEPILDQTPSEIEVVLLCKEEMKLFLERMKRLVISVDNSSDKKYPIKVKLRISNIDWLARTLLRWSGYMKVESPENVKQRVKTLANDCLANYSR